VVDLMSRDPYQVEPDRRIPRSTVRRRELGRMLRQAIHDRGLTQRDVSWETEIEESEFSRILAGERHCEPVEAARVMVEARVTPATRAQAIALADEDSRDHGWPFYLTRGRARWNVLLREAGTAQTVTEWAPAQVPWVVQTTGYTRALLDANHPTEPGDIEDWLRPRRALTTLLVAGWDRSTRPLTQFLIHEHALRTPPGPVLDTTGPWQRAVMAGQLQHLDQLITQAAVPIRVLPAHQGVMGVGGGGFALLEYAHYRPVVYRDEHDTGLFIEDPDITDTARTDIEDLFAAALPVAESRELIARIAAENYGLPDVTGDEQQHTD
jgi:hypothetical protein